ncbi:IS5 family transposase [Actinocatenispora thailandica]|uniref:IS5 family transposase n=1 Tax=Actinocatenispora thailandica TaxID=227318 RepID=A0A7R7HZ26_9ACTN|nr:IS5 family transposase [Actinocatenispora thailandica]BCJ37176.1 IS5 family transposase [Actinocatenispora thailandica]
MTDLDAILFVLRSGCQWRMIPHDLLPWDAAYRWYRAWMADGTWGRIRDTLRDRVRQQAGRDRSPSAAVIDAQSIKSSEGGQARGYDAGTRTTGRKRHIVVDTMGLLLGVVITAASLQDRPGGRRRLSVLAQRFPSVSLEWADGGYANQVDTSLIDWARTTLRLVVQIVKRTDDKKGFQVLPRRWIVERTFGWLVRNRRLARDYERLTANSEAMITIAMIRLMLHRLTEQQIRWSNHTEREAARRLTLETHLAAQLPAYPTASQSQLPIGRPSAAGLDWSRSVIVGCLRGKHSVTARSG